MLQVKVTKMNDLSFKKDLFNPLRTGRKIDEFFSGERGIMPGTNTVITGDPGVGKTTVLPDGEEVMISRERMTNYLRNGNTLVPKPKQI